MKLLQPKETQIVAGAGPFFTLSLMGLGGYLGSSVAYFRPLMTFTATYGAVCTERYSPNPWIQLSGIMLGTAIGYVFGEGLQQLRQELKNSNTTLPQVNSTNSTL